VYVSSLYRSTIQIACWWSFQHTTDNLRWSCAPGPRRRQRQADSRSHHSQADSRNLNTYVNYAFGDESQQAMYGYESWRLEKLKQLKRQYDPRGKFNHLAPITV
jgi:hypothetical protein